jgi:ABC-type lipoprotein release transport system permease subunit
MNGILSRGVVSNNKLIRKINLKYSASQITFIICFITISSIIAGVMIYFGIVSSLIGDPFQGLWRFGIDGL